MVGFCDLVGVGIAPVSKKNAVKLNGWHLRNACLLLYPIQQKASTDNYMIRFITGKARQNGKLTHFNKIAALCKLFARKCTKYATWRKIKVILHEPCDEQFLWNRNWDLGWFWAVFSCFHGQKKIISCTVKSCIIQRVLTDGGKTEFSGARWRPRTGHFTTYTVLSFEAS